MNEEKTNSDDKCLRCEQMEKLIGLVIENLIKLICDVRAEMVAVKIKRKVLYELMNKIGSRPAESGGILLGPVGTNYITHFYFDRKGTCTGGSYKPDHVTLNRKLREEWGPASLQFQGVAHSHPGNLDSLTYGDMSYIKKLLTRNSYMSTFVAPIILPHRYSIHPFVVSRDRIDRPQRAYFEIFE